MSTLLCGHVERGLVWFRVFGYGLHVNNLRRNRTLYSDRAAISEYRAVLLGPWRVKALRRGR